MAKSALRNHLKTIHATTPKYHKCDLCDYQTMRLGNFQRHVRSKHEVRVFLPKYDLKNNNFAKFLFLLQGIRPYKCHICGNGKAAFLYSDMPIITIFEFYLYEILNYLITHSFM